MIKLCIPDIKDNEISAAVDALKSGWLAHGPYNKEFEIKFAEYVGVKHAITCNSCTSALFLALKALDITGEVIIPSFSFVATANAVVTAGATPRFVDIDKNTFNINPKEIEKAITSKTQAIIIVHFAGQCCQMDEIETIAINHGLHLIEDSAETLGGTFNGRQAGSFGIGCFSFFPTKNITTGEGGMITTNDDSLAIKMKALIGHGIDSTTFQREKADMPWFRSATYAGYNFRMSNVLAAIGNEQMKRIDEMNDKRIMASKYLTNGLRNIEGIALPFISEQNKHVFQMYTILLESTIDRDQFVIEMNKKGIGASVHFYPPIHEQEYYKNHPELISGTLSVTDNISKRIVTLPMYPGITQKDLEFIIDAIKNIVNVVKTY